MAYSSAVRDHVAALVRGIAPGLDGGTAPQALFVLWHLAAGLLGFAAIPFVLLAHPAPAGLAMLLLAWPVVPLLVARDFLRRHDLVRANLLSAAAIAAATAIVAISGGGTGMLAVAWLLLPPVQAALIGANRAVVPAAGLAAVTAAVLIAVRLSAGQGGSHPFLLGLAGFGLAAMTVYGALLFRARERLAGIAIAASHAEDEERRRVAESVSDLITQHGSNGAVLTASLSADTAVGTEAASLLGQGLFQRVHVADRPAFLAALARAGGGAAAGVEFRLRQGTAGREAGPPRFAWVEMRAAPIRGAAASDGGDGRYLVVAITRDIGERKAREEELVEARREADRANAAKSRFLATMSHELRTPLNAIIGFSEMLSGTMAPPLDEARRREYAGLIHQSGQHLLSVVNGILDMSKIEAGSFTILPEPLALEPLVAGCVKLLALKAAEGGVQIETDLADGLPDLVADQRACKQILLNLISNSIKFCRPGGHVTVGAARDGEAMLLTVSDTGVGIAAEDLPRLGAPFFQVRSSYDRPYEGTGLGLSVVKGLAELHGGGFTIASTPGIGTRVTVRLPLVPPGIAAAPAIPPETAAWSDDIERVKQSA
ncbi:MAG TPA: PAS domain-containing sensor histidine kinase [Hyphomicrobiales bacterium]|nr:PAS domain-containing sensor histidine kinase [Hyphomicrobiales bacterium]